MTRRKEKKGEVEFFSVAVVVVVGVVESMLPSFFILSLPFYFFTFCKTSQLAWKSRELVLSTGCSAAEAGGTSCRRRASRSCSADADEAIERRERVKKPCPVSRLALAGVDAPRLPPPRSVSGGQGSGADVVFSWRKKELREEANSLCPSKERERKKMEEAKTTTTTKVKTH